MSTVYFQIGTNNGNDLFRKLVIKNKPDCIILVEPNINLINDIKRNYKGIENVYIYNNAIYYNNDETVELFIPAKNKIMGSKANNGIIYKDCHFSLIPMNDWGDKNDMVKITTKSITFDTICTIHGIKTIDYLQIDTEGFDSEIIKMLDFTKFIIKQIRFEVWGFDTSCFTVYNKELSNELGINGMNAAINKLTENNYIMNGINDEDGNDIIARLVL